MVSAAFLERPLSRGSRSPRPRIVMETRGSVGLGPGSGGSPGSSSRSRSTPLTYSLTRMKRTMPRTSTRAPIMGLTSSAAMPCPGISSTLSVPWVKVQYWLACEHAEVADDDHVAALVGFGGEDHLVEIDDTRRAIVAVALALRRARCREPGPGRGRPATRRASRRRGGRPGEAAHGSSEARVYARSR